MTAIADHRVHFSHRIASTIFRNLITCLKEVHDNGIIHRDLKPENFMFVKNFDSPGSVPSIVDNHDLDMKIIDFGKASNLSGAETCIPVRHGIQGTPEYLAPETIQDDISKRVNSRASDIWYNYQITTLRCLSFSCLTR